MTNFPHLENIEIYGFMGNLGVGKNYVAENLFKPQLPSKPTLVVAFADHFKITAICFNNLKFDKVFGQKDAYTRNRLQELGTELGRDKYGDDIWCSVLYNWIKLHISRGIQRIIITDVRYANEVSFVKQIGGIIIKVEAEDRNMERLLQESNNDPHVMEQIRNHSSEQFIRQFSAYDYLINNRVGANTNAQVFSIVRKICNL
jgi:hypothetical protein